MSRLWYHLVNVAVLGMIVLGLYLVYLASLGQ